MSLSLKSGDMRSQKNIKKINSDNNKKKFEIII